VNVVHSPLGEEDNMSDTTVIIGGLTATIALWALVIWYWSRY